jgi:hypothetical protein
VLEGKQVTIRIGPPRTIGLDNLSFYSPRIAMSLCPVTVTLLLLFYMSLQIFTWSQPYSNLRICQISTVSNYEWKWLSQNKLRDKISICHGVILALLKFRVIISFIGLFLFSFQVRVIHFKSCQIIITELNCLGNRTDNSSNRTLYQCCLNKHLLTTMSRAQSLTNIPMVISIIYNKPSSTSMKKINLRRKDQWERERPRERERETSITEQ